MKKERENLKMQREEKMIKNKMMKLISILIIFVMSFNSFAVDEKIENDYFDGLVPTKHIHNYNDKKSSLSNDVINYDDIDSYIHYYNPDILNEWNTWENNKSADDVYEDYMDAADRLYDSAASQDSELQEGMMYAQADAMRIQADKNIYDSYVNFLNKYLKEKQLVLSTKLLVLNYHKSAYELKNAKAAYDEAVRKETLATDALKYGSGTELDMLTAKKATIDAKSAVVNAESSEKNYKRNILINCGKSMNDNITIADVALDSTYNISSINFDVDYQNALKHNIQYEIYKRSKNNARTDEVKKEYDILLAAAPQNIYNDLETKYSNLLDILDTVNNRNVAYNLAKDSLAKAQNEYSSGNISRKEYETAKYNLDVALNNIETSKYDYKIALENYKASVEGLGNC